MSKERKAKNMSFKKKEKTGLEFKNDYYDENGKYTKEKKFLMIGYGTFMTQSLGEYRGVMESEAWGVKMRIIKPIKVEGYRRVCQPHDSYPYVVRHADSSFWGLAFEIEGGDALMRLDNVEGVPRHYTRDTVMVDGEKYFMYVASRETQEGDLKYMLREIAVDDDFWYTRVYITLMRNHEAQESGLFDDLLDLNSLSPEVLRWAGWGDTAKVVEELVKELAGEEE